MTVCIIPARGGSERIKRKNVRDFFGRPMITWSIAAARETECFDRIVVSTDDDEVARIAETEGAEVPFMRNARLADQHTPTAPVIADAIARLGLPGDEPTCCLYATAPFVQASDLVNALEILLSERARFVVSVTTFSFPIQRALRRKPDGTVDMIMPEHMSTRSQDLEIAWHDAGQFYLARAQSWTDLGGGIFATGCYGYPLPRHRVQDIDDEEDWRRAELMMRSLRAE